MLFHKIIYSLTVTSLFIVLSWIFYIKFRKNNKFKFILFAVLFISIFPSIFTYDDVNKSFMVNLFFIFAAPAIIIYTPIIYLFGNRLYKSFLSKSLFSKFLIILSGVIFSVPSLTGIPFNKMQPKIHAFWLKFVLLSFGFFSLLFLLLKIKNLINQRLILPAKNVENQILMPFISLCCFSLIISIYLMIGTYFADINDSGTHSISSKILSSIGVPLSYLTINSILVLAPMVIATFAELKELNASVNKAFFVIVTNAVFFLLLVQYYGWWFGIQLGHFYPWVIRF